jgi:hypothetical protein
VSKHDLGSFIKDDDDRYMLANHRHCYSTKANISTSFEIDTMICNTCTHRDRHRVLRRETERPDTVDDSPICFVLSDQCFPPVLPPGGECFKIVRVEDGGILELVNVFIEITKGFVIPAGSVLLVFSASRLAGIGTEAYAAEYDAARLKLIRIMGDGIAMLQGFLILNHGTGNMALIRGLIDLVHWFRSTHSGRDIHNVRKHCIQLTLGKHIDSFSACEGDGTPGASSAGGASSPCAIALHSTRLMLPIMDHFGRKNCFESPAYTGLPRNT